jgi:hypothetical protein
MTGSWLVELPELMIRPHNAQTVLPFSFFAALPFAGRSPLFRWRAIERGSNLAGGPDSWIFQAAEAIPLSPFS